MSGLQLSITLGTRQSALAMWQTNYIVARLTSAWPGLDCQVQPFVTQGDKTQAQNKPLPEIGGKGLFTAELEEALRLRQIDLAVHSLKDLPVEDAPGLTIGAITSREDVRDALVARNGWTLATLPPAAVVGTSSTRRAAQLLAARPDLKVKSIRGNVETRIRKVMAGDYDATVLAGAGLNRLGLSHVVTEWLPLSLMLPAPGQGALAVQCRAADPQILELLAAIDEPLVRTAVNAERLFLAGLGGGCSAPVAAYAEPAAAESGAIHLAGLVASPDGRTLIRVQGDGPDSALGRTLAQQALAQGAAQILAAAGAGQTHGQKNGKPAAHTQDASFSQPLFQKRVVITRAREQTGVLAEKLSALGAQPLLIHAIQIAPLKNLERLDAAIRALATYDWLVFTSANSVAVFSSQLAVCGSPTPWPRLKVAAVGPATAEAVRKLGVEPALVPADYVAEALAEAFGNIAGQRLLLPQAVGARPLLAERLAQRGALVDAIPIYETLPAPIEETQMAELRRGVDAVLFTSGSTAQALTSAVRQDAIARQQLDNTLIACIGPITAQVARDLGLAVGLVAKEHTTDGLVQALVDYFEGRQHDNANHKTNNR